MDPNDPRALLGQAVGLLLASADPDDHALGQKIAKLLKPDSADSGNGNGAVTEEVAQRLLTAFKIKTSDGLVKMLMKAESVNDALAIIETINPVAPKGNGKVESPPAGALQKIPGSKDEVTRWLNSR